MIAALLITSLLLHGSGRDGCPSRPSPRPSRPSAQASRPSAQASRPSAQASRPSAQASRPSATAVLQSKADELATRFSKELESIASNVDGSVGYLVVDLTTGQRFARRADEPFPTASTIKVGILYELFAQADAGTIALDAPRPLPDGARVGGAGILQRLKSPVISLRDHALLMILLSDNTATNVLIDTLGREAIDTRMHALGARGFQLRRHMMDGEAAARGDENVASPSDLVTVMDALRTGRGLSAASRDAALAILREFGPTSVRAGVPADVPVAAKPGSLDGVRAEVAWVDLKGRPYLICVMASFLADDAAGAAAITGMSRAAYGYFSRLARAGVEGRLLSR